MPTPPPVNIAKQPQEENKIDFRIYVGIILFRWQIISVCFLYSLLAGVLYVTFAQKKYESTCNLMIYRDSLTTEAPSGRYYGAHLQPHIYMLKNPKTLNRVIDKLDEEYAEKVGGRHRMMPNLTVGAAKGLNPMVQISVKSMDSDYGKAFLGQLIEEHRNQWRSIQRSSRSSAGEMLEDELSRLVEQITTAEDNKIDFQRLHDIARVEARGSMETRYLMALMGRRNQLKTELMLLESQYPALENANASVISVVGQLTQETGDIEAEPPENEDGTFSMSSAIPRRMVAENEETKGFQDLRVKLINLEEEEKQLAANLKDDHPKLRSVRTEIKSINKQLSVMARIQIRKLKDRHKSLTIQLDAIESAEYKWKNKNLLASQRQAEYKRLISVVTRYENNYNSVYSRLHDMRVSEELKAEHIVPEDIRSSGNPFWPDPMKILLMALVGGLGSGFGLAFLLQVVDNKVQSIKDVEDVLGVTFLGGIPYWAHSGLENAIRPIVTEEHSAGAIEAYRALRTTILSEMNKKNEKIMFVTSADSREGKTLTTLNMAIMIAQMGKRVLLIDMDLRRGRLHRSLGLDREPGVTDVLRENGSIKDVIQSSRIENLYVAPTGSTIDDSAELLQSIDIVQLFVDVQDDYDYIMVDTSPVLRVTDTVIVSTQGIGVVLYVARVNHTPKPMIRYSLDMLKDADVLGLVMNSIEMHKISSLYYAYQYPNYAYYSNAYTYGHSYYYYDENQSDDRRHRRINFKSSMRHIGKSLRKTFIPTE